MWARQKEVKNAHPAILTFARCKRMGFAHLPEPGGLNNQDPRLLEFFDILFAAEERAEADRRAQEERERARNNRGRGAARGRVAGR